MIEHICPSVRGCQRVTKSWRLAWYIKSLSLSLKTNQRIESRIEHMCAQTFGTLSLFLKTNQLSKWKTQTLVSRDTRLPIYAASPGWEGTIVKTDSPISWAAQWGRNWIWNEDISFYPGWYTNTRHPSFKLHCGKHLSASGWLEYKVSSLLE